MKTVEAVNRMNEVLRRIAPHHAVQVLDLLREDYLDGCKVHTNGVVEEAHIEDQDVAPGTGPVSTGFLDGRTATDCIKHVLQEDENHNNPMSPKDIAARAVELGSQLKPEGIANAVNTCKLVEKVSRGLYRLKETA